MQVHSLAESAEKSVLQDQTEHPDRVRDLQELPEPLKALTVKEVNNQCYYQKELNTEE